MCGRCLREADAFLNVPRNKRPLATPPCAAAPLELRSRDGTAVDAPRRAIAAIATALPEREEEASLPCSELATRIFVDFCKRYHNVGGRAASVELAWRKAILPQMAEHVSENCFELLQLARHMGCSPLERICADELARIVRPLDALALRARLRAGLLVSEAASLLAVFDSVLRLDDEAAGGEAWLRREATAVSAEWARCAHRAIDRRVAQANLGLECADMDALLGEAAALRPRASPRKKRTRR